MLDLSEKFLTSMVCGWQDGNDHYMTGSSDLVRDLGGQYRCADARKEISVSGVASSGDDGAFL